MLTLNQNAKFRHNQIIMTSTMTYHNHQLNLSFSNFDIDIKLVDNGAQMLM